MLMSQLSSKCCSNSISYVLENTVNTNKCQLEENAREITSL
jgi:hypothetical protein